MGFFSWKTQDTDKSIASRYSIRSAFKVDMLDNKGNVWTEHEYEGYGVFGGKDYYELLAEMNGFVSECGYEIGTDKYTNEARLFGINLAFSKGNHSGVATKDVLYPNLIEMADGWNYLPGGPESCEYQGFFYDDEEDDEDEFGWNVADINEY